MLQLVRLPLAALCAAVLFYVTLAPFMNPAPYGLALVFFGILAACALEASLAWLSKKQKEKR